MTDVTTDWIRDRVERIYDTIIAILDRSNAESITPGQAADSIAEARLSSTPLT
ncbi:Rossmann-fold NAD(P)-binding domain-containing protein [Rhodococcus wratislaviensis]|uniref:hypothetical protein n=1 Tax=Rhodococcus wratislaviensis TaxID=44752 RepID=UPI00365F1A88